MVAVSAGRGNPPRQPCRTKANSRRSPGRALRLHRRWRIRNEQRAPLLQLDSVLDGLTAAGVDLPTPRTWRLPLDAPLPVDLEFPLFLRTTQSSLKLGGRISKVRNLRELTSESAELRRLLGWNATILARAWCNFSEAGQSAYGPVPQEIRTWIVDGQPFAWSFHYMHVVRAPAGCPPARGDRELLRAMACNVGRAFGSRCVAADFARTVEGQWSFIEAGPGSCAGTSHEHVFKAVAAKLLGQQVEVPQSDVGGR